jgi:hypothetical protein
VQAGEREEREDAAGDMAHGHLSPVS